jgi:transcriptional regulator with XRE-family HTH domain
MMLNLSQRELGNAIGVSFQQIQKYENGSNRIAAADLLQFATSLAVPITYFFEGAPDCERNPNSSPPEDVLLLTATLRNRDSVELMKAFMKVGDVSVRQSILALVRSLADRTREEPR